MARVLVLGAGFGGISCSLELRRSLGDEHQVTIVDQAEHFMMGLSKLWALDGRRPIAEGRRPIARLSQHGVEVVRGRVQAIRTAEKVVDVEGRPLAYDKLVVALGAHMAPEALLGSSAAHNLYDPDAIPSLADALQAFDGGQILIMVSSVPFKCPPAPYEAAMLIASLLEKRGVRDTSQIDLTTPEPRPLPSAPASCSDDMVDLVRRKGIRYLPGQRPTRVDGDNKTVHYEGGAAKTYDLLIAVPPHRAPAAVRDAGLLGDSGFVKVDPRTLATGVPNVWAIGDVTGIVTPSGKPLPKAGVFAEAQGKVVAAHIAADLAGEQTTAAFDGKGHCFIEVGDGLATAIRGDFFAQPEAELTMQPPSADAAQEKKAFERDRLTSWFGD